MPSSSSGRDTPISSSLHTVPSAELGPRNRKLIIVSNRLPITLEVSPDGMLHSSASPGGLVSALSGVVDKLNYIWVGWIGQSLPAKDIDYIWEECKKYNSVPVFLDQATVEYSYNGFCNSVLWPLFHYISPPIECSQDESTLDQWKAYCRSNAAFVDTIMSVYEDGDLVWVHDYHLALVPKMLRDRIPDVKIGWFLHTPFPSQELFRMLPFRSEILTGLLSSNLIGFHMYDYMRHFLSSCIQLLGLESTSLGIDASPIGGVFVRCATIPIGINPYIFTKKLADPIVDQLVQNLQTKFKGLKVILGIDRLDYMKGIPHKLNAFDRFLELYPEWIAKCVLVQVAVPSRTGVPQYRRLKRVVHELVSKMNGLRGRLAYVPVHYLDQSFSFNQLIALYRIADVVLITSLRDGMNLVSYEYIACQDDKHGVLILTEFAGAAQSLGASAIRINPWNIENSAEAIKMALTMSPEERKTRHEYASRHIKTHSSETWANTFIESLIEASEQSEAVRTTVPPILPLNRILEDISKSKKRLIVIDMIDSLVSARGNRGIQMKRFKKLIQIPENVKDALSILGRDPNSTVIITTSHPRAMIEHLLGGTPACLAAEKGCLFRNKQGEWIHLLDDIIVSDLTWMDEVQQVFDYFQERTPGSYSERTTASVIWYCDDTSPEFGRQQSRDLLVHLWAGPLASVDAEVVICPRYVEVRSSLCSREKLMTKLLEKQFGSSFSEFDFIVCIGNFPWRDEEVYNVFEKFGKDEKSGTDSNSHETLDEIQNKFYSISVGVRMSKAKYCLPDATHVQNLLEALSSYLPAPNNQLKISVPFPPVRISSPLDNSQKFSNFNTRRNTQSSMIPPSKGFHGVNEYYLPSFANRQNLQYPQSYNPYRTQFDETYHSGAPIVDVGRIPSGNLVRLLRGPGGTIFAIDPVEAPIHDPWLYQTAPAIDSSMITKPTIPSVENYSNAAWQNQSHLMPEQLTSKFKYQFTPGGETSNIVTSPLLKTVPVSSVSTSPFDYAQSSFSDLFEPISEDPPQLTILKKKDKVTNSNSFESAPNPSNFSTLQMIPPSTYSTEENTLQKSTSAEMDMRHNPFNLLPDLNHSSSETNIRAIPKSHLALSHPSDLKNSIATSNLEQFLPHGSGLSFSAQTVPSAKSSTLDLSNESLNIISLEPKQSDSKELEGNSTQFLDSNK